MAGEKKGKAYEALTKLVLEDLKADGKLKGRIFWDERPEAMTIVPDLTIGRSANAPDFCLLVTHSESSKNSTFKSWRNLGELSECKVFLPSPPTVLSIIFDSSVYPVLKRLGDASFDGQLIVGDLPYGKKLLKWMEKHFKSLPKDKNEKVDSLRDLSSNDEGVHIIIGHFKDDVEKLLKRSTPEPLRRIWEMEKRRKFYKSPTAKDTFVRRGLCKLLLLADLDSALHLYSGKRVKQDDLPDYVYDLGLASRAIGRASPTDTDIANLVVLFDENAIRRLLKESKYVTTQGFWNQLEKVKNIALLDTLMDYILENRDDLITQRGMLRSLEALHTNPLHGIVVPKGISNPKNVWLFDVIGALIKAATNKAQDFGFSTFSKHRDAKSSKIGTMWVGDWCTCFFNQYLARRSGFKVPAPALRHAALVLSESLASVEGCEAKTLKKKLWKNTWRKSFLPHFLPIAVLTR
jgi:hypothetical protein